MLSFFKYRLPIFLAATLLFFLPLLTPQSIQLNREKKNHLEVLAISFCSIVLMVWLIKTAFLATKDKARIYFCHCHTLEMDDSNCQRPFIICPKKRGEQIEAYPDRKGIKVPHFIVSSSDGNTKDTF